MGKLNRIDLDDVTQYVENNIITFHQKRINSIENLKLNAILKKKNPYLFKAKNILTTEVLVKNLIDAHISSNEETIFGDWLEGLAIFINTKAYGGYKSGISGIDLEFENDNIRYIVSIKSGPSWGNGSQIKKMISDFKTAKISIRTSNSNINVIAVNGCCYGKLRKVDKGDYFKYCGQRFWEFISGEKELYTAIIEPLGYKAKEKNEVFFESYAKTINIFTKEFANKFCLNDGSIDWNKIVEFNSKS